MYGTILSIKQFSQGEQTTECYFRYEVPFIQSLLQVYAHVANSLKQQ